MQDTQEPGACHAWPDGRAQRFEMPPMSLQLQESALDASIAPPATTTGEDRRWFAVFTLPQNEKSVVRHLAMREVEAFLPTYETVKLWKNRQRVRTILPLFPTYLFARIGHRQRSRVLESPGVIQIVGNGREPVPVSDATIELLRAGVQSGKMEPFRELVVGKKVRIKSGAMEGVQGTLVRKSNGLRFVLTIEMIKQYASIEVGADDLEAVVE